MNDKDAIEILKQMRAEVKNDKKWLALNSAIKALEGRPHGKWVFGGFCVTTVKWYCNQCHMPNLEESKFCPNCGADMI